MAIRFFFTSKGENAENLLSKPVKVGFLKREVVNWEPTLEKVTSKNGNLFSFSKSQVNSMFGCWELR